MILNQTLQLQKKEIKMRILFLGDVVGISGCSKIKSNLLDQIKKKKIDFVIANGENAADEGVGITEEISNELFYSFSSSLSLYIVWLLVTPLI